MQLRPGDRVIIEYEAEVLAVHRGGGEVTGFELAMVGAPPGETWLVLMEALHSSGQPMIRPVSGPPSTTG
jgi:hypothetical protein